MGKAKVITRVNLGAGAPKKRVILEQKSLFPELAPPVKKPRRSVTRELKEWDRQRALGKRPEEMNFRVSLRKVRDLTKTKNTEELQKIERFLHPLHRENIDAIRKNVKRGRGKQLRDYPRPLPRSKPPG